MEYLKSVSLEIPNVTSWSVFQNQATYVHAYTSCFYIDSYIASYVLQKRRKDKVGSICTEFADLKCMKEIGRGGFGIVYMYTQASGEQLAVKQETKACIIVITVQ